MNRDLFIFSQILFPNSFNSWGQVAHILKKRWNIAFNHSVSSCSSSLGANTRQRKPLSSKEKEDVCLHSLGDIGSCFLFLKMKQSTSSYRLLSSNSQTSKLQINSTLWPCRQLNLYFNTNYIYLKHCKNEVRSITFRVDPRLVSSSMNPQKKKLKKKVSFFFMESGRDEKRKNPMARKVL